MHGLIGMSEQVSPQPATVDRWYALLTRAGLERRACIWLRIRQLEPYWPRYNPVPRPYQDPRKVSWRSVIPGYMFLPAPADCALVEEAPGVRVMRDGDGAPIKIPNDGKQGIAQIREIAKSLNDDAIAARDGVPFYKGQKVRVIRLEVEAKIDRIDSRRRVVVSVPMFGSVVPLTLSVADIESV